MHGVVLQNRVFRVVEHNSAMVESVADVLRHSGLVVEIADNGEVPIRRAQTEDFSITLMHVHMSVMNGADSGLEIKRPKPQARVVMMTGLDEWVADSGPAPSSAASDAANLSQLPPLIFVNEVATVDQHFSDPGVASDPVPPAYNLESLR
jgi:CheY-like chemotaxis protein